MSFFDDEWECRFIEILGIWYMSNLHGRRIKFNRWMETKYCGVSNFKFSACEWIEKIFKKKLKRNQEINFQWFVIDVATNFFVLFMNCGTIGVCCVWYYQHGKNVPIKLWYERSRRHGSINSAAVGIISIVDFSGLARVEYCLTKRAFDESNPGKFAMCAMSELLLVRSESATDLLHLIDKYRKLKKKKQKLNRELNAMKMYSRFASIEYNVIV